MRQLEIIRTSEYRDCEQCSGGSAEGARIELDGKVLVDLVPVAHCFSGISYNEAQITQAILHALGITDVEVTESFE
jgi:hypothetical protein